MVVNPIELVGGNDWSEGDSSVLAALSLRESRSQSPTIGSLFLGTCLTSHLLEERSAPFINIVLRSFVLRQDLHHEG